MPGPPPAGVSSTLRWRSVAESLMSRASSDHRPDASALPARLTPSGPGNISGNSVRIVARHIVALEVIIFHDVSAVGRQTICGGAQREGGGLYDINPKYRLRSRAPV